MRDLTHPRTLKPTVCFALGTAILCFPRLSMWAQQTFPIWYLEAGIFTGAFVLWGFVFAWHTKYTGKTVLNFDITAKDFVIATLAGIAIAIALRLFLDPLARHVLPEDYPLNLKQWLAMCLFALALTQLFTVFAPFAWLMRLFKHRTIAIVFTVLFGLVIAMLKLRGAHLPVTPALWSAAIISRLIMGIALVTIYLRGGLLLTSWLVLLICLHYLPVHVV